MTMLPERFKQIDELFEEALASAPADRAALLDSACAADDELRLEVESLLAAHARAGNFIESHALEIAAKKIAHERLLAEAGRRIGPYQLLSPLGAGGMGEVYLALDTRLNRQVALKLLPPEFMSDAGRLRRFEREASAASALSHPNIVTILDVGQADGAHYIATEYVEGRTLRQLMSDGKLKIEQALSVFAQIADALAAAHRAGVIHRDIKPENIMLRPDGYVKVLDFGIVKLAGGQVAGDARHLTETDQTETGAVIGTIAYMSPEQALGRSVDHRTDIFSLGVILYELLAGRHPFRGETQAATFDAILNRAPPMPISLHAEAFPELESLLFKALEKNPELRYQTIEDLSEELRRLQRTLDSGAAVSGSFSRGIRHRPLLLRKLSNRPVALVFASLLVIALALSLYFALRRARPLSGEAAPTSPVNLNYTQLTNQSGQEISPSLSPDGKTIIYAARETRDWNIYWQRVGGRNPRNLTLDSTDDDTQPAFSPDGEHIAFRSERDRGGIFIMGATGESVRRLTDSGYFPTWSPDGREIAFSTELFEDPNIRRPAESIIWIVNVSTGEKRQLTDEKLGDAAQPAWSPTGARIAYWGKHKGGQRDIWTIPTRGGQPIQVTDDAAFDWNPVWSPDGKFIYFASDRGGSMNIWRIPLEEQTGHVTGPPEPLTTPSSYAHQVTFSHDGQHMAYISQVSSANIFKVDFNPYKEAFTGQPVAVTQGFRYATEPDLSPDGEWFVYSSQGERQEDLYLVRKDGTQSPRKLTDDAFKDRNPRWSPDGTRIVFYSDRTGRYEAWMINPDGSGLRQVTYTDVGWGVAYPFWSPDGTRLGYDRDAESCSIIEVAKPWNEQTPQRLSNSSDPRIGVFWAMSWSPDGRKLGGWTGSQAGTPGIVTYAFATGGFERLTDFGSNPLWLRDNQRLLFNYQSRLYLVNSATKKVRELVSLWPHRITGYGLSGDNRLLYYSLTTKESDVWLLDIK